jgi:hypothetical protein
MAKTTIPPTTRRFSVQIDGREHSRWDRDELVGVLAHLGYDPPTMMRRLTKRGRINLKDDVNKFALVVIGRDR